MPGFKSEPTVLQENVSVKREHRRLRRERKTVRAMVGLYCSNHHGTRGLCGDCSELASYADRRLDLCPYGSDKPSCTNCPIHCYRPDPRVKMREIMRFSGPRMLVRHPWLAIMHLLDDRRAAPPRPSAKTLKSIDGSADTDRDKLAR